MERIIELLTNEIEKLMKQIDMISSQLKDTNELEKKRILKEKLEMITYKNVDNILKIDLIELEELLPNVFNDEDKRKILFLQSVLKTNIFPINEEQRISLVNCCKVYIQELNLQINEIEENVNRKLETLSETSRVYKLNELKGKIMEEQLSEDIINDIEEFIQELDIPVEKKIEELIELGKYLYQDYRKQLTEKKVDELEENQEQEEVEDILENEIEIDENDLIELFAKYQMDYNELVAGSKEQLRKYGSLTKIESILKELEGLVTNLKANSKHITNILIYSSTEIVRNIKENIIEDAKENLGKEELKKIFAEYLKNSNIFIKGIKQFNKHNKNGIGGGSGDNCVCGQYDNYFKNRELLKSFNVDINQSFLKCGHIFSTNHNTILKKMKCFDFYGIPRSIYLNTLSCFDSPDPLSTIDQFIELGCYDYLLQNFSRLKIRHDDPIIYRIVQAKQKGLSIYISVPNLVTNKGKYRLSGKIVNGNGLIDNDNIDESNGREKVGQYEYYKLFSDPLKAINEYEYYEYIISSNENGGPLDFVKDNYLINCLEENFRDKNNSLIYNIGGEIISRYKVLRIFDTLISNGIDGTYESLMYAICRNSILTENQCRIIANELSEKIDFRIKRRGVE